MPPPIRNKEATEVPGLHWLDTDDGSRTLWDSTLDESYHSGCGALAESLVVYLLNSGALRKIQSRESTRVFELGFGTGSAFLLTAAVAQHHATPLDYWSAEIRPLPASFIERLDLDQNIARVLSDNFSKTATRCSEPVEIDIDCFRLLPELSKKLTGELQRIEGEKHFSKLQHIVLSDTCSLNLIIGDATAIDMPTDFPRLKSYFDAVYFDAFSPETNPCLWTESIMKQMFEILRPGGTLTSYCVKSVVRKTLQSVGFEVNRLPGPVGGKREVLKAHRPPGIF
jgi:tRNA U34 5-methylaminomethyl-2-thiouridine-forming methyltransferase MnmC